ncbi:hypothetical protein [Pedobacter gandavensis]|uniref:hypothetical protein n=1 Tax=Pedobacter gandavensis TaxID=2679963 RepID=UPI00293052CC|nr:hypothetical protein [Pedobacter gandavensis]
MRKHTLYILSGAFLVFGCHSEGKAQKQQDLAAQILADSSLTMVDNLAKGIIKEGFNAGSGYSQIWARDFNTLIETSLDVRSKEDVRGAILMFFALQQKNDEMVDGYVVKKDFTWNDDTPYYSDAAPNHVGFKNTVETDQETSLIQLVGKYIQKTGDVAILKEEVAGVSVLARMEKMIAYLLRERYNKKYGLLWGAMTADWGDVQPNDTFGCDWNELSNEAIDVYDNAMFMIALQYLIKVVPDQQKTKQWAKLEQDLHKNVRKHLWDTKNQKFIPHIYPGKSPIPAGFDENAIHYHGGTAVAIEAGLLSKKEIATVNKQMVENVKLSGMPSIGLTIYPTYPAGFFTGGMAKPYVYQNGGDWTWFGGRMIQQLIANGFVKEAYEEVRPMIDRVVKNQGFYEWYGKGNIPDGSGKFKGSAGVLSKAILQFKDWAAANQQKTK